MEYEELHIARKKDLYDYIIANKVVLNQILLLTYTFSIYLLLNNENFLINLPFVGLLQATQNYKEIVYWTMETSIYIYNVDSMCSLVTLCIT